MKICLGQLTRPKDMDKYTGCGDCVTCKSHPDNVNCSRYWGIELSTLSEEECYGEETREV